MIEERSEDTPDEAAAEESAPAEASGSKEAAAEDAPAVETEEPPAVETEEPPAAESEEPPAAETEEPPAAETDEPPAAETEDVPAPEAEEAPPAAAEEASPPAPRPRPKRGRRQAPQDEPEVIPGAHLEPDLVLEDAQVERAEMGGLAGAEIEAAEQALEEQEAEGAEGAAPESSAPAPAPTTVLELAADARYRATGKRKSAVARVTLKPGTGVYTVNGRDMAAFFPRPTLQTTVRQPLEAVGQEERMDVVAKIHGGGVSAQAGALRHGISKALTEADPNLRAELKRRGFLTRDARVKERKKAGLKKARKRPQFSKR